MLLVGGYCPREDYEDSFLAWFSLLSQAEVVAKQVARGGSDAHCPYENGPQATEPCTFWGLIGLSSGVS